MCTQCFHGCVKLVPGPFVCCPLCMLCPLARLYAATQVGISSGAKRDRGDRVHAWLLRDAHPGVGTKHTTEPFLICLLKEIPYDTGDGSSNNVDNTGVVDEPADVSWMVVQAGTHTLPGGITIVVSWKPLLTAST